MKSKLIVLLTLALFLTSSATISMAELIAHWTLDDGTGNVAVDLVGGFEGTLEGDPAWDDGGVIGGALVFDGDGDYVQTDLMEELQTAENFTITAWFKTNVTASGQHHILWEGDVGGNGWGSQQELHIGINHFGYNNKVVGYYGQGGDLDGLNINIVSLEDFTDTSQWHHLALVIENANGPVVSGALYLDGEWVEPFVDGFETGGTPFPTIDSVESPIDRSEWNTPLRIGSPGAAQRYFDGMIDDVTVWNQALSEDDVKIVMQGEPFTAVEPHRKLTTTWGALK